MNEITMCSHCGCEIEDNVYEVEGEYFCEDCYEDETFECECCGGRFLNSHDHGDENIGLCPDCYDEHYHRCVRCNCLIHSSNAYWYDGDAYCSDCYEDDDDCEDDDGYINDYYYKPSPEFYKCPDEKRVRYYGVELEIDRGGRDKYNAEEIYNTANKGSDVLYIKSDGSLDDGMELVSHPCSLKYHRYNFPWFDIMQKAKDLYYRSHNTSTCGLHIHIGRAELGATIEQQEEVIGRIMFFFESHWNEMLKFSRRSEYSLDRWASRYGYKDRPKEILEDAKKNSKGRYVCVNITNDNTVEIRMFRGTLKWNTFMATIEMVDSICENAFNLTDSDIHKQSWNDFVMLINPEYKELIKYLKEKRLYVNEPVENEEEI